MPTFARPMIFQRKRDDHSEQLELAQHLHGDGQQLAVNGSLRMLGPATNNFIKTEH